MTETIIVAIIAFAGTLVGSYFSQRKSTALISYRIQELEKKVGEHNNLVSRTYKVEERCGIIEEKIKVSNNRIADLEAVMR